jgi:hypothetical protein
VYQYLADVVVAIHAVYIGFVLFGQLAILVGAALRWTWVRNVWFRWAHLAAIVLVALEAILGVVCPLTLWEDELRHAGGEQVAEGTFIGRCLHDLVFYDAPAWVFTTCYIAFAGLVILTFAIVPPRRRRTCSSPESIHAAAPIVRSNG